MNPICTKCLIEMRCEKNDMGIQIGRVVFHSNIFRCPICGAEVAIIISPNYSKIEDWHTPKLVLKET